MSLWQWYIKVPDCERSAINPFCIKDWVFLFEKDVWCSDFRIMLFDRLDDLDSTQLIFPIVWPIADSGRPLYGVFKDKFEYPTWTALNRTLANKRARNPHTEIARAVVTSFE